MDHTRPIRLTGLQTRAMRALHTLGTLDHATRLDDGIHPPWVVSSTIKALHRKGLVDLDTRERMRIQVGENEFCSPVVWYATLTEAGRTWLQATALSSAGGDAMV